MGGGGATFPEAPSIYPSWREGFSFNVVVKNEDGDLCWGVCVKNSQGEVSPH